MTWELALKWTARMLGAIMPMLTPAIKKELERFIVDLHAKALKTKNPLDDYITKFLMDLFGLGEQ